MEELVKYLIKNITGQDVELEITQEADRTDIAIKAPKDTVGLIIGKGGTTIKNIRKVVKMKAMLDKQYVNVFVEEAN